MAGGPEDHFTDTAGDRQREDQAIQERSGRGHDQAPRRAVGVLGQGDHYRQRAPDEPGAPMRAGGSTQRVADVGDHVGDPYRAGEHAQYRADLGHRSSATAGAARRSHRERERPGAVVPCVSRHRQRERRGGLRSMTTSCRSDSSATTALPIVPAPPMTTMRTRPSFQVASRKSPFTRDSPPDKRQRPSAVARRPRPRDGDRAQVRNSMP